MLQAVGWISFLNDPRLLELLDLPDPEDRTKIKSDTQRIEQYCSTHRIDRKDLIGALTRIFEFVPIDIFVETEPMGIDLVEGEGLDYRMLSPRGLAALCYLGSIVAPKKGVYKSLLDRKLSVIYRLPAQSDPAFLLFRFMANHEFIPMVPEHAWVELVTLLEGEGVKRIVPRHLRYYYMPGVWNRHNALLQDLQAEMARQQLPDQKRAEFWKDFVQLRDDFRREVESNFNIRNQMAFTRAPFFFALHLQENHELTYTSIRTKIRSLIKQQNHDGLKSLLWNNPAYAAVFLHKYYALTSALHPDAPGRGRPWKAPKEVLSAYVLKIYRLFKGLEVEHPNMWCVKFLNTMANEDVYDETTSDSLWERAVENGDEDKRSALDDNLERGQVLNGETAFRDDLRRLKARAVGRSISRPKS